MSDRSPLDYESSRAFERTEAMVRAARRYLRPSEDLRPRTLEHARRNDADRRTEQKLGGFALAVMMLAACSAPVVHFVDVVHSNSVAPSAAEIQERGFRYAAQPEIGPHWGLAEAFTQMQRSRADRLGHTLRAMK